jgi:hypothetical protein
MAQKMASVVSYIPGFRARHSIHNSCEFVYQISDSKPKHSGVESIEAIDNPALEASLYTVYEPQDEACHRPEDSSNGVHMHCNYNVNDQFPHTLFPREKVYQEDYLQNVKTMMGMLEPSIQLYQSLRWAPAYAKVMGDLSQESRKLDNAKQSLDVDMYAGGSYFNSVFDGDCSIADKGLRYSILEKKIRDTVASVIAKDVTTWEQFEKVRINNSSVELNPKYAHIIEPGYSRMDSNDIYYKANKIAQTLLKVANSDSISRVALLTKLYHAEGVKSYLTLILLLLGGDLDQHVSGDGLYPGGTSHAGDLGFRFTYVAKDLPGINAKTYDIGDNINSLASVAFVPVKNIDAIPNQGTPRLFDLQVKVDLRTLDTDPKLYLLFSSNLKETKPDPSTGEVAHPFSLDGIIDEKSGKTVLGFALKNVFQASFHEPQLIPNTVITSLGDTQYRYIEEVTGFNGLAKKFMPNTDYVAIFNLTDKDMEYAPGDDEHFSEMVKMLLRLKR